MSLINADFTKDIVLDDEAFNKAVSRMEKLATRISTLQTDITNQLENLRSGFDTPAGKKFFAACGTKLLDPMKNQAIIIDHVSKNLKMAKTSYDSVFQEFSTLNNAIRNIK